MLINDHHDDQQDRLSLTEQCVIRQTQQETCFIAKKTDLELAPYEDRIDACANRVIQERFMQYIQTQTEPVASLRIGLSFGFHRVPLLLPIISLVSFTLFGFCGWRREICGKLDPVSQQQQRHSEAHGAVTVI